MSTVLTRERVSHSTCPRTVGESGPTWEIHRHPKVLKEHDLFISRADV